MHRADVGERVEKALQLRTDRPRQQIDAAVMALAAAQHGVVSRAQVLAAGVSPDVLARRVSTGTLRAVHRGVYQVGPIPGAHAREMAAFLACGPSAVVSHRSAAGLWELARGPDPGALVDLMTIAATRRRRPGIRIHRVRTLDPDEVTRLEGIPVTTPTRTLYDLAGNCSFGELERALEQAVVRCLVRPTDIQTMLARYSRRPGSRILQSLFDGNRPKFTRSRAEKRFLAHVRRARMKEPAVNVQVAGNEVDFVWRAERLVVEVDGFVYHSSPGRFERDRSRDTELAATGWTVMRVSWRQICDEPEAVVVRVAQALALNSRHSTGTI